MIAYKYMSIERVADALKYGVYAARLDSFNDPYEYEGIRYLDNYRVCCLARSAQQMLMWSYYGNHRGCCVAFSLPDNLSIIKGVKYRKDYYQHREMDRGELVTSLYTKAYEWRHENEVRIVYDRRHADASLWCTPADKCFFIAKVEQVVFGLRADFKAADCQELLVLLRDNYSDVDVKQCMLSSKSYKIMWDRQFDYLNEIVLGL